MRWISSDTDVALKYSTIQTKVNRLGAKSPLKIRKGR